MFLSSKSYFQVILVERMRNSKSRTEQKNKFLDRTEPGLGQDQLNFEKAEISEQFLDPYFPTLPIIRNTTHWAQNHKQYLNFSPLFENGNIF